MGSYERTNEQADEHIHLARSPQSCHYTDFSSYSANFPPPLTRQLLASISSNHRYPSSPAAPSRAS